MRDFDKKYFTFHGIFEDAAPQSTIYQKTSEEITKVLKKKLE